MHGQSQSLSIYYNVTFPRMRPRPYAHGLRLCFIRSQTIPVRGTYLDRGTYPERGTPVPRSGYATGGTRFFIKKISDKSSAQYNGVFQRLYSSWEVFAIIRKDLGIIGCFADFAVSVKVQNWPQVGRKNGLKIMTVTTSTIADRRG